MKKFVLILAFLLICNLGYTASEWNKSEPQGLRSVSDLDYYQNQNNTALDRVLANYNTIVLSHNSASQITASIGEVVCSNSDGSTRKMRQNTSATTVTWAMIDTGAEAASTTYYVYADADADATTAVFKISLSSTSPTGVTSYKKIGSFYNNSSSNIDRTKIYTVPYGFAPTALSGQPPISAVYSYGTSYSSYTANNGDVKIAFGYARDIAGNGTQAVTNLPFTSSSTYSAVCAQFGSASGAAAGAPSVLSIDSGSQFTIKNNHPDAVGNNGDCNWIAIGY